jgi:hypothetical protein
MLNKGDIVRTLLNLKVDGMLMCSGALGFPVIPVLCLERKAWLGSQ